MTVGWQDGFVLSLPEPTSAFTQPQGGYIVTAFVKVAAPWLVPRFWTVASAARARQVYGQGVTDTVFYSQFFRPRYSQRPGGETPWNMNFTVRGFDGVNTATAPPGGWPATAHLTFDVRYYAGYVDSLPSSAFQTASLSESVVFTNAPSVRRALPSLTLPSYTNDRVIGNVDRVFQTSTAYSTGQTQAHRATASSRLVRPRVQTDTGNVLVTTGQGLATGTLSLVREERPDSRLVGATVLASTSTTQLNVASPGESPSVPVPDLPLPTTGSAALRAAPDTSVADWGETRSFLLADVFAFDNDAPLRVSTRAPFVRLNATRSTASGWSVWDLTATSDTRISISFAATAPSAGWQPVNAFDLVFDFGGSQVWRFEYALRFVDPNVHVLAAPSDREMSTSSTETIDLSNAFTPQPQGVSRAYAVVSSSSVVTASVTGSSLTLTSGSSAGFSLVKVSVTDTASTAGVPAVSTFAAFAVAVRSVTGGAEALDRARLRQDFDNYFDGSKLRLTALRTGTATLTWDASWLTVSSSASPLSVRLDSRTSTVLAVSATPPTRTAPVTFALDGGSGLPFSETVSVSRLASVQPASQLHSWDAARSSRQNVLTASSFLSGASTRRYSVVVSAPDFGYSDSLVAPPRRGSSWASSGASTVTATVNATSGALSLFSGASDAVAVVRVTATDTAGAFSSSFTHSFVVRVASSTTAWRQLPLAPAVRQLRQLPQAPLGWRQSRRLPLSVFFEWTPGVTAWIRYATASDASVAHVVDSWGGDRFDTSQRRPDATAAVDISFNLPLLATNYGVVTNYEVDLVFNYGGSEVLSVPLQVSMLQLRVPVVVDSVKALLVSTNETDHYVVDVSGVFEASQTGTDATVAYAVASSAASVTARIDAGRVLLSTGAATTRADVTLTATATSGPRFSPAISRTTSTSFGVSFTALPALVYRGISDLNMYSYETARIDLLAAFDNSASLRVEGVEVLTSAGEAATSATRYVDAQLEGTALVLNALSVPALRRNRVRLTVNSDAGVRRVVAFSVSVLASQSDITLGVLSQSGVWDDTAYTATLTATGATSPSGLSPVSYRWRVTTDGWSQMRETSAPTASFVLPAQLGEEQPRNWMATCQLRAGGFASTSRDVAFNVDARVTGRVAYFKEQASLQYKVRSATGQRDATAADVSGFEARSYGATEEVSTPAVLDVSNVPLPDAPQHVLRFSVAGTTITDRHGSVSASGAPASTDSSYTLDDNDVTGDVLRLSYSTGRTVSAGALRAVSGSGEMRLRTQLPADVLLGKRVRMLNRGAVALTAWVAQADVEEGTARLVLGGVLSTGHGEVVHHIERLATQASVTEALLARAHFYTPAVFYSYESGVVMPPCYFDGGLFEALHAVETFGGMLYEDQYGRVVFGTPAAPANAPEIVTGLDAAHIVNAAGARRGLPVVARHSLRSEEGFNAADLPLTPASESAPAVVGRANGRTESGGYVYYTNLDMSTAPGSALVTMRREGLQATASAGAVLRGRVYERYTGNERLDLELPRDAGEHRLNIEPRLAPRFGVSAASYAAAVAATINRVRMRTLTQVSLVVPTSHAEDTAALRNLHVGYSVTLDGTPRHRVEWQRFEDRRDGALRRTLLLSS